MTLHADDLADYDRPSAVEARREDRDHPPVRRPLCLATRERGEQVAVCLIPLAQHAGRAHEPTVDPWARPADAPALDAAPPF